MDNLDQNIGHEWKFNFHTWLCPFHDMDLSISQNGQFHTWVVKYMVYKEALNCQNWLHTESKKQLSKLQLSMYIYRVSDSRRPSVTDQILQQNPEFKIEY